MDENAKITLSIVSHGHGQLVFALLKSIIANCKCVEVILTINTPERYTAEINALALTSKISIQIISNDFPQGFGTNHNIASRYCNTAYFAVVNPDIKISVSLLSIIEKFIGENSIDMAYPHQVSEDGHPQDYERPLVTPWQIIMRHFFKSRRTHTCFDWVCGAFMLFRIDVFKQINGFDESYFMYCEDVDICIRLQLEGYRMTRIPATVVHDSRRNTKKSMHHFFWHISSLIKLWTSRPYWKYLRNAKHIR